MNFCAKAKAIHGKKYDYSKVEYKNNHTLVCIVCPEHGEFWQRPADHWYGRGCKACGTLQSAKSRNSAVEFVQKAKAIHGKKYDYSKVEYKNNHTPVCIVFNGKPFWQRPDVHWSGGGSPDEYRKKLSDAVSSNTGTFIAAAKKVHGSLYDYSLVNYTQVLDPITIICQQHGKFQQKPNTHLNGHGCPKCSPAAKSNTSEFLQKARAIHGKKYDYSKVKYTLATEKITITCPTHGEYKQRAYAHLRGQECPRCARRKTSSQEEYLVRWLEKIGKKLITQARMLDGKEIDIYLPEHNLGIEINGLYWHSEKFKTFTYHQEKSGTAENQGIQLLHFWEHQINNKALIVKSMLRIKLGLAKLRIFARECSIRKIESAQAKVFLDSNHLQGNIASSLQYGLFLDEKLVSVMTLGKPRFNKQYEWEIIRLATLINTVVVGGASKLFSAFCRENSPKSVISYADLDYADGGVYKNLGFTFKGFSNPSYFWVKGHTAVPRYRTQKHKLHNLLGTEFDPNLSERENMQNAGYLRVFNSGNAIFTWAAKC